MRLSLPSSPNYSYQTCALDERMNECNNEALDSFIYTSWQALERCLFTGQGRLVFLVVNVGQLRGGVNQLLPCLNNNAYFKFFAEHLMTITIMQGSKQ
jgi:hypothetical protein